MFTNSGRVSNNSGKMSTKMIKPTIDDICIKYINPRINLYEIRSENSVACFHKCIGSAILDGEYLKAYHGYYNIIILDNSTSLCIILYFDDDRVISSEHAVRAPKDPVAIKNQSSIMMRTIIDDILNAQRMTNESDARTILKLKESMCEILTNSVNTAFVYGHHHGEGTSLSRMDNAASKFERLLFSFECNGRPIIASDGKNPASYFGFNKRVCKDFVELRNYIGRGDFVGCDHTIGISGEYTDILHGVIFGVEKQFENIICIHNTLCTSYTNNKMQAIHNDCCRYARRVLDSKRPNLKASTNKKAAFVCATSLMPDLRRALVSATYSDVSDLYLSTYVTDRNIFKGGITHSVSIMDGVVQRLPKTD